MKSKSQNPSGSRARRWYAYLWHEWIVESRRPIAPAFARPNPAAWSDNRITAAWLGHATVLINFFGIKILTDPVLFSRIGIRLPGLTLGPKRLTASALTVRDLPKIDILHHHQTFRLSSESFREPIERFRAALHETPERIAIREIGETFTLP